MADVDFLGSFMSIQLAPNHWFRFNRWGYGFDKSNPWEGHECIKDDLGRKWLRPIDRAVVDDFGNLVEVEVSE